MHCKDFLMKDAMTDEMKNNTPGGEHFNYIVPPEQSGQRLDQALASLMPDRTRAFIKKLFDRGLVSIDTLTAKPALKVKEGAKVSVFVPDPEPLNVEAQPLPLDILYEDNDLVVVNKRPGMVAHPSHGHRDGTLVNALLHHYGDSLSGIGGVLRPGIVHRLDRDTSGCLVAAKNDKAHAGLMRQFMGREVGKIYLALTEGPPRPLNGKVEGNIGRSSRDRKLHAMIKTGGRYSLTEYRTLENYGLVALVECNLHTGRTHQARVHLAHLGSPVLCDADYGKRSVFREGDLQYALDLMSTGGGNRRCLGSGKVVLGRQGLHAWQLSFRHPSSNEEMTFTAPLPEDMSAVLEPFRKVRRGEEGQS